MLAAALLIFCARAGCAERVAAARAAQAAPASGADALDAAASKGDAATVATLLTQGGDANAKA